MRAIGVAASFTLMLLVGGCCSWGGDSSVSSAAHRASSGSLVPTRVVVASRTVVYVLARDQGASAASASSPPTALLRSDTAGATFRPVTAPTARDANGHILPVREMSFVDAHDGYALLGTGWRGGTMVVTDDGARTWRVSRVPGPGEVETVAGHGGVAYAATVACRTAMNCSGARLYRASAGSTSWTRVSAIGVPQRNLAGGLGVAAWGRTVWLTAGDGESSEPHLLRSDDAGGTFAKEAEVAAIDCAARPTSSTVVWLSCSTGMLIRFYRVCGPAAPQALPVGGSGTGPTLLAPISDTVAYVANGVGAERGLAVTDDAGRGFRGVGRLPPGYASSTALTFLSAQIGLDLQPGVRLLRTPDGGRRWYGVRL